MNYAVTGANGLIGRFLVQRLAADGHEVLAICRSNVPAQFHDLQNIRIERGDVTDSDFLNRVLKRIDGVYHVAAFAKPWVKETSIYYRINELGTENVARACLANGIKRLVITSTAGIHGPQKGHDLVNEQSWPEAYHTDYEQSKFNGRARALEFVAQDLDVMIVSPPRVYAPGEITETNVPVRMMNMYLKNRIGVVPGDGTGIGSYVHMDDVVHGHILAMEKGSSGEDYLIGGSNRSYVEFFETIAEVTGKSYPIIKVPYPMSLLIGKSQLFMAERFGIQPKITTPWVRKYLENWGVDSTKLRKLGYNPIELKEGLKHVFETTF